MRLKLISSAGEVMEPQVPFHEFNPSERMRFALKRGGLFFGLAVASVFIPIFHFFLVPLFLLLTVIMGMKARKTRFEVPAFDAACPRCKKSVHFDKIYLEDVMRTFCPECRDQLRVTIEE